jgi:hypothetical protein
MATANGSAMTSTSIRAAPEGPMPLRSSRDAPVDQTSSMNSLSAAFLGVQLEPAGSRGGLADVLVAKAGERVRATWVWPHVPCTSGPVNKSMSTAFIREAPLLDEFFSNRGGRQRHT